MGLFSNEPTAPTPHQAGPAALQSEIWGDAKPGSTLKQRGIATLISVNAGDAIRPLLKNR
jgi:hypothetical protein